MWDELATRSLGYVHLPEGETGLMYLCSPNSHVAQRPDVVRAIHATAAPNSWTECRGPVHRAFSAKHSNSSITVLPKVLERIPVLLFAGDQDLICNYVGIENMMQAMTWNGATGLGVCFVQVMFHP